MILRRFYDDNLAQASYLVGCSATGEALVVDPNRDVAQYMENAAHEGLRITHVTETHIHADFVSGLRELCAATGATPYLSAAGPAEWQYAFAAADNAVLLDTLAGEGFTATLVQIGDTKIPTKIGKDSAEDLANRIGEQAREGGVMPETGADALASTAAEGHSEVPHAEPTALGLDATAWVALAMPITTGLTVSRSRKVIQALAVKM